MMTAEPDSGLPPRLEGVAVPTSEMLLALTKEPPDEVGQVKPAGAPVSLAQEWMPPRVWMPVMPAPTPEMAELKKRSPFSVPSRSTMTELDWVELTLES